MVELMVVVLTVMLVGVVMVVVLVVVLVGVVVVGEVLVVSYFLEFTSWPGHIMTDTDLWFVPVRSHGYYIVLPHWETRQPTP